MNEKDLSKFLPEDAIFRGSRLDGKHGVFKIWFSYTKDGIINVMKFIRKNGHWVFQSDSGFSTGH